MYQKSTVDEKWEIVKQNNPWRDSYDFEIHHREEVSISGVLVKT